MATDPLGPRYWENLFGITTFEQFQAATNGALDLGLPHISWVDTPLQRLAYEDPLSVTGTYLTAALTASGFHEDSPSGPATVVVNSLSLLLNQAALGVPVPQLVIPGAFQVSIEAVAGGHPIFNVIGVTNPGGNAAGAAAAVKTAWEIATGPLANLINLVTMVNYHAVDLSSGSGTIADLASTTAGGVTTSAAFATRGACALIAWNGATRQRASRGRLYYGPIREADTNTDGATLDATRRAQFGTAFTAFRNSLTSSGYPLAVLSRSLSVAFPVTQHTVEGTIATQRRRIRN